MLYTIVTCVIYNFQLLDVYSNKYDRDTESKHPLATPVTSAESGPGPSWNREWNAVELSHVGGRDPVPWTNTAASSGLQ